VSWASSQGCPAHLANSSGAHVDQHAHRLPVQTACAVRQAIEHIGQRDGRGRVRIERGDVGLQRIAQIRHGGVHRIFTVFCFIGLGHFHVVNFDVPFPASSSASLSTALAAFDNSAMREPRSRYAPTPPPEVAGSLKLAIAWAELSPDEVPLLSVEIDC
jgi:hypothetical protein